jgi:polysaccharide deacetylase family protein (PEP-CTERM system associated)
VSEGRGDRAPAAQRPGAAIGAALVNAMSVDVEDYFQVHAFGRAIRHEEWESWPRRVERNTERLLDLFAAAGITATFFTLGWVGKRHPGLLRRILAEGHELGSHGLDHVRVDRQTPAGFRAEIARAKAILEDAGGVAVLGYRAPGFSITPATEWAFECLAEAGYRYSSSVDPARGGAGLFADADAPLHKLACGLVELPVTSLAVAGRKLPCGGGFFRLLPYAVTQRAIRQVNAGRRQPAIFYIHPWEIDPDQPRVAASLTARLRHYTNLRGTEQKLATLLGDFAWGRIDRLALAPSEEGRRAA